MTVEEAIRVRILSLSAVTAIVGSRVWADKLPENAVMPCVLVQLVDGLEHQHLRGPDGLPIARVQVDARSSEGSTADPLGQVLALMDAIHGDGLGTQASGVFGWKGGIGSPAFEIRGIRDGGRTRGYEPDEKRTLVRHQDYLVRYVG